MKQKMCRNDYDSERSFTEQNIFITLLSFAIVSKYVYIFTSIKMHIWLGYEYILFGYFSFTNINQARIFPLRSDFRYHF